MIYSIKIKASAKKSLIKLEKSNRLRLIKHIDALANNPFKGSQLKGELTGLRRIRVGQYRVIYEVQNEALVVLVIRIGHRKEIYR